MAKRHRVLALATFAMFMTSACTSLTPVDDAGSSLSTGLPASAAGSAPPNELASAVTPAPSVLPTATPAPSRQPKTPKPQKSASATATVATLPNLVITNFATESDQVGIGAQTNGTVTISNDGTADAGAFTLGLSWTADSGLGGVADSPKAVDPLAAGDSEDVTVDMSLSEGGGYTFTATVDANDQITESNEDDNTATVHVTAVDLPNLVFAATDGLAVVPDESGDGGYEIDMVIANTGTLDVTMSFDVALEWSTELTSGSFDPFSCCTTEGGPVVAAGSTTANVGIQGEQFPGPGTYQVHAFIDPEDLIKESNESDNQDSVAVTVP